VKFEIAPGASPLDPDAQAGLIPALSTQAELNEFEERNILAADRWARRSRALRVDYPNVTALKLLHRRMFDQTWRWAGEFRRVDTNIGIDWHRIPMELHGHCENTRAWIAYRSYPWDELAVRFHHELVLIHPFPNGNGRHGRLATDILLRQHGQRPFTWGSQSLVAAGAARREYIAALREADAGLFARLLAFVRT
jgi:Fic-DOC domain mobile mystery protein B